MQRQAIASARASDGEAVLQRAMAALDRGDIATAAAEAQLATDLDQSSALAWELLSLALHRGGALEQAISAGRRAIDLEPSAASYHANLGVVLRLAGRTAEAEASYRAAIAIRPALRARAQQSRQHRARSGPQRRGRGELPRKRSKPIQLTRTLGTASASRFSVKRNLAKRSSRLSAPQRCVPSVPTSCPISPPC